MRALTLLFTLTLTSLTPATAAALLGTKDSFSSSRFCQIYACQLAGKDVLGRGLSEWRYRVKGEFPVDMQTSPTIVTVLRQNDVIISSQYVTGAQDVVLYPGNYTSKMMVSLVESMTGKAPTPASLLDLNGGCGTTAPQVRTVAWKVGGKDYRLSCLLSPEYSNASRFSFHVHLP